MSEGQPKPSQGDQSKTSILERLTSSDPTRNVAFIAIEQLEDPEEMRQFMDEYSHWLGTQSDDPEVLEYPERTAKSNIGYITGFYDKETADLWMKVFEDLSHPVFGLNIPFNDPEVALHLGVADGIVSPKNL